MERGGLSEICRRLALVIVRDPSHELLIDRTDYKTGHQEDRLCYRTALAHERLKLLPNQTPFINGTTRHTLSALAATRAFTAVVLIGAGCQNVSGSLLRVQEPKRSALGHP